MNEELIRQCVDEAINPEDYPAEGGYRTAQDGCAFAIRLYHARAVAPLVEAAREKLHQRLADIGGCLDGNCMVVRPKGVHTNGGCQCLKNWTKTQQVVNAYKAFEAEVSTLKRPEPSEEEKVEKVAAVIERELMIDEGLLADPATLRKIKSQRIARAALKAMGGE